MPQASHVLSLALIVGALQALSSPLVAQSISSGTITGTVRSPDGRAVPQAVVTLTPLGTGSSQETTTTASGSFTLTLVQPGSYEIRVEALGYRPLIARVLTIRGGEERNVNLTLNPAPPPVTTIDTVALSGGSSTRFRAGGVQLGGSEIASLPYRFEDLASIAALSTAFDASLGSQGLPGDMSLVIADGVPFYRAPHPTARAEYLPDALFPRSALASVTAFHNAPDAEWAGSAGGYLALATRSSTGSAIELDGAYSGGPTWSSSELDFGTPSLLSFQGGARGTVLLTPGVSQVVLSGEALQQQTPLGPRVSEALAADLVGLDPELLTSLTEPAVETYTRYSALARLDVQRSRTSRVFLRGVGSFSRRDFDGAGPVSLARSAAPAEESIEFSAAGGIISESSPNVTMELRGGFSGSYRDFGTAVSDLPPAYLTALGVPLGNLPSAAAESSRTDFVVIPVLRYTPGTATLKFGATIRASSHTMAHSRAGLGDFLYSDAAALLAGTGFGQATSAPKASFGTQEYGVFAQYESALAPGLRLSFGGRYDYERFSGDDVALNTGWLTASGLRNDDFPDSFHQFGARGSLTWDPSASGGTRIFLTASMHEGDVDTRALYQLFADDTDATSTRFAGTGIDWPMGGIPPLAAAALPTLTLFGPDTRAPRSTNMSAALTQRMGDGLSVYVRASVRRTDFLMRRRNLNLPIVAQAADPNGRRILGTLQQDGSLITTTTDDARRFAGFGEVWALDPDGWSEYKGFTAALEHSSSTFEFYGSYTFSETTDNWVGAASGSIGATLSPGLPEAAEGTADWSEGTSDFDIPHRLSAGATVHFGSVALSGIYHFRSGLPFTPRYRTGVDANGDGSIRNDVAFVPGDAELTTLLSAWPCLDRQTDAFAVRNSCRGPEQHTVNVRLKFRLGRLAGRSASLTLDGFNLVEGKGGVIDDALLLVDPSGGITTSPDGSTITIPFIVNPGFGEVLYPSTRGRMLRIGLRIGG